MSFKVYLSGEIHTDWRQQIIDGCQSLDLDVQFSSPVTNHEASDAAGDLLEPSADGYWRDHKSAKVNAIRIRTLIENCDMAVIRFGNQYKQWNAAFDAGYCAALRKPYVTLHDTDIVHALKEVDAAAQAWAQNTEQVIRLIHYTISAK